MEKQISPSLLCDENVRKDTQRRQTDALKEGETSSNCQGSDRNKVGEDNTTSIEQCTNKCTRPTFSNPDSELSVDNKVDEITTTNIDIEQRRVSRRDEHERTLKQQQQHSCGQLEGGLDHISKKVVDDSHVLPSQTQEGSKCTALLPTQIHASTTTTRVIITPADDEDSRKCMNTLDDENLLVGDLQCKEEDIVKSQFTKIPTCVEDITRDWILFVMKQHQMRTFGRRLSNVGQFTVEMASLTEGTTSSHDPLDKATVTKVPSTSQHVLSNAFNVIVEVPDPPENEEEEEEDEEEDDEKSGDSDEDCESKEEEERNKSISSAAKTAVREMTGSQRSANNKTHHLFVKVPPKNSARFERMVKRNRTLEHEVKVYSELMRDLKRFVKDRVGTEVTFNIPTLYHGFTEKNDPGPSGDRSVLVIEDLCQRGFTTRDWFKTKLNHAEVLLALEEMAKFHACGLAYRMSLKEDIVKKYPYLSDDLYTSNMSKEILAKYFDTYLHFLSFLPGIKEHVNKLRKIGDDVFNLLVKLRRPTDSLGTRFNTICHGDMWMGNLMFKDHETPSANQENTTNGSTNGSDDATAANGEHENPSTSSQESNVPGSDQTKPSNQSKSERNPKECYMIDFHSAQFLSPATDLAHLLLTSTTREYRKEHWDEVVQHYYDIFNVTLAEFGLVLRHLGTTYKDFLYEVKRALRGQFLCVAFIIPIVIYCGPTEWRFERRRGSSIDRKNTVRHLIQMMAINEEGGGTSPIPPQMREETEESGEEEKEPAISKSLPAQATVPPPYCPLKRLNSRDSDDNGTNNIPHEFESLYNDPDLRQNLIDVIETANDLDILDFDEFCGHTNTPKPMYMKTKATTGKHIPVY